MSVDKCALLWDSQLEVVMLIPREEETGLDVSRNGVSKHGEQ